MGAQSVENVLKAAEDGSKGHAMQQPLYTAQSITPVTAGWTTVGGPCLPS